MNNNAKQWKLWLSAGIIGGYLLWLAGCLLRSGGTVWGGIAAWVLWPHAAMAVLAAVFSAAAALTGTARPARFSLLSAAAAAVVFPPLHVFLIVPAALTASGLLGSSQSAARAGCR